MTEQPAPIPGGADLLAALRAAHAALIAVRQKIGVQCNCRTCVHCGMEAAINQAAPLIGAAAPESEREDRTV